MTPRPDFQAHEACETTHYMARELLACRRELRDILIAPFSESKCKGIGYNISPSELCYSVKKKYLLQVHRTDQETYVLIPPHDTVLILSYEYLQVSSGVAGCFLSRLRPVTQGLGNISTTLDPCWKGMLLLAINNPSSKKVKRLNDAVNNCVGLCPLNRINDVPAGSPDAERAYGLLACGIINGLVSVEMVVTKFSAQRLRPVYGQAVSLSRLEKQQVFVQACLIKGIVHIPFTGHPVKTLGTAGQLQTACRHSMLHKLLGDLLTVRDCQMRCSLAILRPTAATIQASSAPSAYWFRQKLQ